MKQITPSKQKIIEMCNKILIPYLMTKKPEDFGLRKSTKEVS